MYKEYSPYRNALMAGDIILSLIILAVMVELRPLLPGRMIAAEKVLPSPLIYPIVAILMHMLFVFGDVYQLDRITSLSKQIGRLTSAYILLVLVFAGLLYFTFRDMSRMLVIYFCVIDYLALVLERYLLSIYLKKKRSGMRPASALIVGSGENAVKLADVINKEHSAVVNVIGFADDVAQDQEALSVPLLGSLKDVPELVRKLGIDIVMIALSNKQCAMTESLIRDLESVPVRIYLVPDIAKLFLIYAEVETFGDLVAIGIREPVIRGGKRVFKRIMDVVLSSALLVCLWPVFLVIWIAIKLDSPGPAIFVAKRVGENGKIFNMYKFRTMFVGAEAAQGEVTKKDEQGRPIFKTKDDPRITRVGRFLRRTSLDELPQLINVLKGEMSLVGPRPEQPFITELYDQWQWRRLSVPPGITGWWQVNGRSDLAMHLNSHYDIYYAKNYSILLDLKILLKTLGAVIKGRGAY